MGNCFAKFKNKRQKSVSEILSQSSSPRRSSSGLKSENEMLKELSVSEFNDTSSIDTELGNISDTVEYTEVQEIHLEKPGFSYIIGYADGRPDRMPSRLVERSATRIKSVSSLPKLTYSDEVLMDDILWEAEGKRKLQEKLEYKQKQAKKLREAHLNNIKEKAREMSMGDWWMRCGDGDMY